MQRCGAEGFRPVGSASALRGGEVMARGQQQRQRISSALRQVSAGKSRDLHLNARDDAGGLDRACFLSRMFHLQEEEIRRLQVRSHLARSLARTSLFS